MFSPDADDVIQSQTKKEEQTLATLKIRKLFNQLVSPFPEMTFRFPPFYKFFGKDIMRLGRGGRKFESCRLDEDEIPGNVEKSRFPGVFLWCAWRRTFRLRAMGALSQVKVLNMPR